MSETALIHATWEGHVKIVEALIAANASLNIRERVSCVRIMLAMAARECVQLQAISQYDSDYVFSLEKPHL